jgi:hypothetical protein
MSIYENSILSKGREKAVSTSFLINVLAYFTSTSTINIQRMTKWCMKKREEHRGMLLWPCEDCIPTLKD